MGNFWRIAVEVMEKGFLIAVFPYSGKMTERREKTWRWYFLRSLISS